MKMPGRFFWSNYFDAGCLIVVWFKQKSGSAELRAKPFNFSNQMIVNRTLKEQEVMS